MDSTMHFTLGLAVGTCALLPPVLTKIKAGERTHRAIGKLLAYSYLLGIFAITPNLLRHSGLPDFICSCRWMNIFLLNPLLDMLKSGGLLIGEILIVLFFIFHYSIILTAILKTQSRKQDIR